MANFNWNEYRPTKAVWFWSVGGAVVATMILGFTWGGWTTGGTADEMAADAREQGRAQLAANICVDRFLASPEVAVNLAALKDESSYQRDNFIDDGGWVTFAGMEQPVQGAGEICASQLADMDVPAANEAAATDSTDTVVN
jgi:hypothetical protein